MAGQQIDIPPNPRGRPTKYTQDLADRICGYVADGITIRSIVAMDDMPVWGTILNWQNKHPDFLAQYRRAREASAQMFEAEVIDVARSVRDAEDVPAARLLLDAMKWSASRRNRKMYGDKEVPDDIEPQSGQTGMTVHFVKGKAPQTDDGDPAS